MLYLCLVNIYAFIIVLCLILWWKKCIENDISGRNIRILFQTKNLESLREFLSLIIC